MSRNTANVACGACGGRAGKWVSGEVAVHLGPPLLDKVERSWSCWRHPNASGVGVNVACAMGNYSSSGKGPRGKIESLARCLSPPRASPPLAGGLVAVVVPRVRRADCPFSSGCCVTAPAAYPPVSYTHLTLPTSYSV